jgi:hypothetical protein
MIRGAQAAEGGLQGAGACAPLGKQMPALGLERRCSIVGGKSIFFSTPPTCSTLPDAEWNEHVFACPLLCE